MRLKLCVNCERFMKTEADVCPFCGRHLIAEIADMNWVIPIILFGMTALVFILAYLILGV